MDNALARGNLSLVQLWDRAVSNLPDYKYNYTYNIDNGVTFYNTTPMEVRN